LVHFSTPQQHPRLARYKGMPGDARSAAATEHAAMTGAAVLAIDAGTALMADCAAAWEAPHAG
jgi:hypothetical protein